MGKKDIMDREYLGKEERAAELLSHGLYHGLDCIMSDSLARIEGKYASAVSAGGELTRDLFFQCGEDGIKYGLEIENYADPIMAERVMEYDAYEYAKERRKIKQSNKSKTARNFTELKSGMRQEDHLSPVITLVVYLGEGHYLGARRLKDTFGKELHPGEGLCLSKERYEKRMSMVQNYSIAVIEADYVNPMDYKTDLRQFFQAMQCRKDKRKLSELFKQEEFQSLGRDVQQMIAVHLNIRELKQKVVEEEEEMCQAYEELKKDWLEEGRQAGKEEMCQAYEELKKDWLEEGRQAGKEEMCQAYEELKKDWLEEGRQAGKEEMCQAYEELKKDWLEEGRQAGKEEMCQAYEELKKDWLEEGRQAGKEEICQAYEELKKDWLEEGRQAGKLEGKLEAQCEMIQQTIQAFDITAEQAMGVLKVSDEVKEFYYKKYTNSSEI